MDVFIQIDAVEPVMFFFDLAEYLQPSRIGKSFGYLFRLLRIHLRHMTNYFYVRYGISVKQALAGRQVVFRGFTSAC